MDSLIYEIEIFEKELDRLNKLLDDNLKINDKTPEEDELEKLKSDANNIKNILKNGV